MTGHAAIPPRTSGPRAVVRRINGALNSPRAPRRLGAGVGLLIAAGLLFDPPATVHAIATALLCVFMVSLTVGIHELCHLVIAAHGGVRVNAFYIGFGPVLITRRWHGIDWGVRAYPVGGYVDLYGEERDEGPDSFYASSPARKLAVLLAGPLSNFVLAFLILTGLALAHGFSLVAAPGVAWALGGVVVEGTMHTIASLVPVTAQNPLNFPLMGVPGMVGATSTLLDQGPDMVVVLIAVFSASVGFTNLLPIPPLDGGKAVLVLAKVVLRDQYPDAAGLVLQRVSFAFIIALMIAINGIDIARTLIGYQLTPGP